MSASEMPTVGVWWHLGPWWTHLDAPGLFQKCMLHASAYLMFSFSFPHEELGKMTEFLTVYISIGISVSEY